MLTMANLAIYVLVLLFAVKATISQEISRRNQIHIQQKRMVSISLNDLNLRELYQKLRGSCEFDPDETLDVPQIIRRHGYPSESHVVESEDGYLLTVHRIPGGKDGSKGGQPVYLQHGLLGSSADWVLNGNTTFGKHEIITLFF